MSHLDSYVNVPDERRELTWRISPLCHICGSVKNSRYMSETCIDLIQVTRSYIPAANVPARIDVPVGHVVSVGRGTIMAANQSYVPA